MWSFSCEPFSVSLLNEDEKMSNMPARYEFGWRRENGRHTVFPRRAEFQSTGLMDPRLGLGGGRIETWLRCVNEWMKRVLEMMCSCCGFNI
jgi:hypothetical protein